MQIKYFGGEKFEIKTKETVIVFNTTVSIGGFLLPGPGEYEKNGIIAEGIANHGDAIYVIRAENMNICYLGLISNELTNDEVKQIGDVDILFVPLGENGSVDIKKALSMISKIDPRIVIPMLYSDLTEFKKSEGITDGEIDILKIKKDDLPTDERRNVILIPQS